VFDKWSRQSWQGIWFEFDDRSIKQKKAHEMTNQKMKIVAQISLHSVQPLTFTHHSVDGLPLLARGIDQEGRHLRTVYIPAAQFRGRVRHEAALSQMRSESGKVKLEEAYMLALGQDLRPAEDDAPEQVRLKEQIAVRKENPLLDLFGTWKLASRLYVSHFMPEVNVLPAKISHIRRDLDTNEDMMDALGSDEQDRMYDRQSKQGMASQVGQLIKLATRELMAAKKAKDVTKVDEIEAKILELKELKKTQKGDDDSENTKHLVELEFIPAGITLNGKLTVNSAIPNDLRVLVDALVGFGEKPYLGAQRARGCGEVALEATFKNADGDVLATVAFAEGEGSNVQWTEAGTTFLNAETTTT
jgi:CRISPR/Cas system CSM-associated protein Csm3 (group 7 of RAMP superfamily)